MKVRTAPLLVAAALFGCRPGEVPLPPPTPPAPVPVSAGREPSVRVGITVDSAAAVVSAGTPFELRGRDGTITTSAPGEVWTFRSTMDGRLEAMRADGSTLPPLDAPVRVIAQDNGLVSVGGRSYRGELLLLAREAGRVTAVNVVDLELYLLGVVPREIGRRPASEIEAIKAQAVAARTYAVGNIGGRESLGFDFFATVMDQVYGGAADEDTIVSRAVRETRGEIITHDGRPIIAYYSSTCGGRTAAIEESWPWRSPQPYLKAVSDLIPGSDSAYCGTSSRYRWSATWTREQLIAVLGQTLRTHTASAATAAEPLQDIGILRTNDAGRAEVRLVAGGREYILRSDSVRWVLRPPPGTALLNSSRLFEVRPTYFNGEVDSLTITGAGWGHGIGMCQVGAMGRARAGQSYEQILKAYYTGTEIRKLF